MRKTLQFKVRLNEQLHSDISSSAEENKRSLNAEIVSRLETSILVEKPVDELLPADLMLKLSNQAKSQGYTELLDRCILAVRKAATQGRTEASISIHAQGDKEEISKHNQEVITRVTQTLKDAGYSAVLLRDVLKVRFGAEPKQAHVELTF